MVGLLGRRAGQPQVVAEMLAGVLLGPSVFGLIWPELFAKIFPPDSRRVLFPVAQLGLAAYMFVVGLEFRVDIVRVRMRSAVAVSMAGLVLVAAIGGKGVACWLAARATGVPNREALGIGTLMASPTYEWLVGRHLPAPEPERPPG